MNLRQAYLTESGKSEWLGSVRGGCSNQHLASRNREYDRASRIYPSHTAETLAQLSSVYRQLAATALPAHKKPIPARALFTRSYVQALPSWISPSPKKTTNPLPTCKSDLLSWCQANLLWPTQLSAPNRVGLVSTPRQSLLGLFLHTSSRLRR